MYMETTMAIFLRFPIIPRELIPGYLICIIEKRWNNRGGTNGILGNKLLPRVVPASKFSARNRILLRTKLIPRRSPPASPLLPPRPTLFRIIEKKRME